MKSKELYESNAGRGVMRQRRCRGEKLNACVFWRVAAMMCAVARAGIVALMFAGGFERGPGLRDVANRVCVSSNGIMKRVRGYLRVRQDHLWSRARLGNRVVSFRCGDREEVLCRPGRRLRT